MMNLIRNKWFWALAILCIVGFILRIINLDYLILWVDEYVHVDRARFFPAESIFTDDNNGILYTFFVIPFFKIFSVNEFWARFPSVMFGVLSIPLLFLFCKKYFNKMVGLMAAIMLTFSEYHVFWSRIARNYAIFLFFFLLLAYFLGEALNVKQNYKLSGKRWLDFFVVKPKTLLITILVFIAAILSHQLTFLIIYAIGFYHFLVFVVKLFQKKFKLWSPNTIIALLFLLFCVVTFVPAIQKPISMILAWFMPTRIITWVLPNFERLKELWATNRFDTFMLYFNIMKASFKWLYILAGTGFIIAFYRFKRSGIFLFSIFAPLLFLMSFIYREPALPRYFIYLFPFFLIAIAVSFHEIYALITMRSKIKIFNKFIWVIVVASIFFFMPIEQSFALVNKKEHGQVVSKTFSHWFFPDWKIPLQKTQKKIQKDDIVLSTIPSYIDFYSGKKSIQLRQRYYDTEKHAYQNFVPDTTSDNANSLEAVIKLHQKYDRGWLFADYYFKNVMTDQAVQNYIVRNWDFNYDLSNQDIKVFSWDKSQPHINTATMLELLSPKNGATEYYTFNMPSLKNFKNILLEVDAEGINFDSELMIEINQKTLPVLFKQRISQTEDENKRQIYHVDVPLNYMISEGENKVRLLYNVGIKNKNKKAMIAVYNMVFKSKQ